MKPSSWIAVIVLGLAVTVLVTWVEAHSRLRRGIHYDTTPKPLVNDPGLVLTGTLGPVVTTRIDARNVDFTVPLNSWVLKGQVIGEADSAAALEQNSQEFLGLEEANIAVADAKSKVREINDELAIAHANARDIESELISSETAELEERYEFDRRDRQFRQQAASQLDHDEAVSARDSAVSAVTGARSRLRATSMKIDELEMRSREAKAQLSQAIARSLSAEDGFGQSERSAGRAPLVSPADGLLVASDMFPGTFGIASDAALFCVHTHIHQADIASLRLGQPALIEIYGDPTMTLHARVSGIGGTLISFPDGAAYPITLSVDDTAGKGFNGASVQIRLGKPAQTH